MEVFYNGTKVPQVFFDTRFNSVNLPPRFAFTFDGLSKSQASSLNKHSNIKSLINSASKILFVRNYALGDILMLLPVLREFKNTYPDKKIYFATTYELARNYFIRHFASGIVNRLYDNYQTVEDYDLGILLDDVVERDHTIKEYSDKHRVDIFRECLSLPTGHAPVWNTAPTWVGFHGIIFCSGGKKPIKQLSLDTADYFLQQLSRRKFRNLLHVREGLPFPPPEQFLLALQNARVLITMDTAPLWMAHYTRTPVVFLSGPTRGAQRISYHPLYPEGAREVSFSQELRCKPCFENNYDCHLVPKCFTALPKERMWLLVEQVMEEVMWTN